jgi:Tol biopolymer transport system component
VRRRKPSFRVGQSNAGQANSLPEEITVHHTLVAPRPACLAGAVSRLVLPLLVLSATACDSDPVQPELSRADAPAAFNTLSSYMGQILVTSATQSATQLFMVDPVTKTSVQLGSENYAYGNWSPDYTKIAFSKQFWDGLYIMNADGTDEKPLWSGWVDAVSFSPDGTQIAFIGKPGSGSYRQLRVVDLATQQAVVLTNVQKIGLRVSWSPDGTKILFYMDDGKGWNLFTIAPDGTGLRQLTRCKTVCKDGQYSPDGKQVAFIHGGQIAVATAMGTKMQLVTSAADPQPHWPSWSPDGTQLAYERAAGHQNNIWVLTLATGATDPLVTTRTDDVTPNWSR